MHRFRNRDYVALMFGLLVAGGLAGWAAVRAVDYFSVDDTTDPLTKAGSLGPAPARPVDLD